MKIDEQNFIQQMRLGNEQALMYVIDKYGGLLKSVIRKNMSCLESMVEECLNDVLLSIWNNIEYFDGDKNSFKNWIAAIAKYKAIDYMRRYRKEVNNISYENEKHEASYEDSQLEELLDEEITNRFNQLLSCLKERDREIFIRLYANEESIDEVSKQMNISKNTLYNRISRAKKKMRKGDRHE